MYKPVANKILVDVLVKTGLLSAEDARHYVVLAKNDRRTGRIQSNYVTGGSDD